MSMTMTSGFSSGIFCNAVRTFRQVPTQERLLCSEMICSSSSQIPALSSMRATLVAIKNCRGLFKNGDSRSASDRDAQVDEGAGGKAAFDRDAALHLVGSDPHVVQPIAFRMFFEPWLKTSPVILYFYLKYIID